MEQNLLYGYMRLSKRDRNKVDSNGVQLSDTELLARQQQELERFGVSSDRIFSEGIRSGVAMEKPALYNLLGLNRNQQGKLKQTDVCKLPKDSILVVCGLYVR